jgi:Bacterial TSP3 repeat
VRSERGQSTTELLGLLVVVVAILAALISSGIGGSIAGGIERALCRVIGGTSCSTEVRRPAPRDTDNDGVPDARERRLGLSPTSPDTDGDGLSDGRELRAYDAPGGQNLSTRPDPRSADRDHDGLTDAQELAGGTLPGRRDSDTYMGSAGDGVSDGDEIRRGTNPVDVDTDHDGTWDGDEVDHGDDPLHDERSWLDKAGTFAVDVLADDPVGDLVTLGFGKVAKIGLKSTVKAVEAARAARAAEESGDVVTAAAKRAEAVREAAPAARITTNKANGDAARDRIAAELQEQFPRDRVRKEVTFDTSLGPRRVDVLQGRTAHEVKVGRTGLTSRIRSELAKDSELLASGDEQVREVVWRFERSPATGRAGPSAKLERELCARGIAIVVEGKLQPCA